MLNPISHVKRRLLLVCGATLLAAGAAGCETTAQGGQANLLEDSRTCSEFGSDRGSRAYSECMLAQQRRRDTAELDQLEKYRLMNESARDAAATAEIARRSRCARDPDRRECGRR